MYVLCIYYILERYFNLPHLPLSLISTATTPGFISNEFYFISKKSEIDWQEIRAVCLGQLC